MEAEIDTPKWPWVEEFIDKEGVPMSNIGERGTAFSPCIFKAPRNMRMVDGDNAAAIYDPVLVSIGPFHHKSNNEALQLMEDHKCRFFSRMIRRLHQYIPDSSRLLSLVVGLADAMEELERKTRECYSEAFLSLSQKEYVRMMVLDGCFILEIFRMYCGLYVGDQDDLIFSSTRWMLPMLWLDLLKLENQLPFFVLEKLYEMTILTQKEPSLVSLARTFVTLCPDSQRGEINTVRYHNPEHLLALYHSTFQRRRAGLPSYNREVENDDLTASFNLCRPKEKVDEEDLTCYNRGRPVYKAAKKCSLPSVNDLLLSGVKVVKKKTTAESTNELLQIEYHRHRVELVIPTLVVDHTTRVVMRNLVAYEQCNQKVPSYFTSYVTFIDALVNSAEDVETLRIAGVVDHFMNSNEEVNKLLNNLTAGIDFDMRRGYLADINSVIYYHHNKPWSQFKVRVRRFVNSHEGMSCIIAVFALYVTLLQTVFTVLPLLRDPDKSSDFSDHAVSPSP